MEALDALAHYTCATHTPQPGLVSILDQYPLLQNLLDMLLFKQVR